MSDNEEEVSEREAYPVELEHRSHRRTPPPMDERDAAEMSHISADIDDAEKFELTFEIVDSSAVDEGSPPRDDEEIAKILTPPSGNKKNEVVDENLDEEAPENDENSGEKRKIVRKTERKSMAAELLQEFRSPLTSRRGNTSAVGGEQLKRKSGEPLMASTPKRPHLKD